MSRDAKRDSLKIKTVAKEERQEVDVRLKEELKHSHVAREMKPVSFTGTLTFEISVCRQNWSF